MGSINKRPLSVKVFTNKTSHFVASWYQPPGRNLAELTSEINLLRSQLQKIKCMHKGNKPPSVHVLGDFNFGDIVWPDRLNKSGSPLSPSEGEILIEIMNDYGLEQLVHFPTRERNTLDLIITSLPGQFVDIHSPDRLSDHDIVSGTLKVVYVISCRNFWLQYRSIQDGGQNKHENVSSF